MQERIAQDYIQRVQNGIVITARFILKEKNIIFFIKIDFYKYPFIFYQRVIVAPFGGQLRSLYNINMFSLWRKVDTFS